MKLAPNLRVLLAGLDLPRRPRIADVGANPVNPPPYAALLAAGQCDVIGFEPLPEAFERLQKRKSPRETYLPLAVGRGGPVTLKICEAGSFTSVHEPNAQGIGRYLGRPRWAEVRERAEMQTVALDEAPGMQDFDLLKMDLQGGEGDVLAGAARRLENCVAVITESRYYPLYVGEPMHHGVGALLAGHGFVMHKTLSLTAVQIPSSQSARLRAGQVRDQMVDGDVVFIRDPAGIDGWPEVQVAMLAVLAAAVFSSQSLVLYCLDALVTRGRVAADLPARYVDALPRYLRARDPGELAAE